MEKRILSVVLAVVLVFGMASAFAGAENTCEHHRHDAACGGLSSTCTYVCEPCVARVQALIDVLPAMNEINDGNKAAVAAQLSAIDAAKLCLSDAARAKLDYTKYGDAAKEIAD